MIEVLPVGCLLCLWLLLLESLRQCLVMGKTLRLMSLPVLCLVVLEALLEFEQLLALLGAPRPVLQHTALRHRIRASLHGEELRGALDQGF